MVAIKVVSFSWRSFVVQNNTKFCKIILILYCIRYTNSCRLKTVLNILSKKYDSFLSLYLRLAVRSQSSEKRLLASSCPSICLHGTRFSLDEFSWNFILGVFTNLSRETSSLGKIEGRWQALCVKTTYVRVSLHRLLASPWLPSIVIYDNLVIYSCGLRDAS